MREPPAIRPRPAPPRFAQVGRPPPGADTRWSRPLILLIAVGIFASLVALLWEIQRRQRYTIVEITLMDPDEPPPAPAD